MDAEDDIDMTMEEERLLLNINIPGPDLPPPPPSPLPQEGGARGAPPQPPAPPPPTGNNRVKCVVSVSPCLLLPVINSEEEGEEIEEEDMQHCGSSPNNSNSLLGLLLQVAKKLAELVKLKDTCSYDY